MIKPIQNYDKVQGYGDYVQLPKGGYVCKILGVAINDHGYGDSLDVSCDIVEGEYANYYSNDYKNQQKEDKKWHCTAFVSIPKDDESEHDGWTKRKFKTFTDAVEESNEGYHWNWDETTLKGKLVGGLFNIREYWGNDNMAKQAINLGGFTSVEKIRSGKFHLPKDKLLDNKSESSTSSKEADTGSLSITSEDLPF